VASVREGESGFVCQFNVSPSFPKSNNVTHIRSFNTQDSASNSTKLTAQQCDLIPPRCGSCQRLGFKCDFEAAFESQSSQPMYVEGPEVKFVLEKTSIGGGLVSTRTRSSSQLLQPDFTSHDQHSLRTPHNIGVTLSIPGIEPGDQELMNHFYNITSLSITDVSKRPIWQELAPREAVCHPWAFQALLSFTALHIAYLVPSRKGSSHLLAMKHQARAVTLFNKSVAKIDKENCNSIVLFSALTTFGEVFKLNLTPEENGTDILEDLSQVFGLFGRMRAIWVSCSHLLKTSKFAPLLERSSRRDPDARLAPHAYAAFAKLEQLNEATTNDPSDKETYSRIIKWLVHDAENVLLYPDDWSPQMHGKAESLPARFFQILQERDPLSFVIMAHYCVIVHHCQKLWCMEGWRQKVFHAIVRALDDSWQPSLAWAIKGMSIEGKWTGPFLRA
jgi:hypothetical protein